jgi:hypothetical protein
VAREAPGAVSLFKNKDRQGLASLLNGLLSNRERLASAKQAALDIAREKFCWEKQETWLVTWITDALNIPAS